MPPVHEAIVDLILEMKRENQGWGGQRISDELCRLGVLVSKKTVLKILRENGLVPHKKKFNPPSWKSLLDCFSRIWATKSWISQQFRNAAIEAHEIFPDAIVRDNDALFKDWLDPFMKEFDVVPILIDPHCPRQNGRTERVQRTEKDEVLRRAPIADVYHCAELNSLYRFRSSNFVHP